MFLLELLKTNTQIRLCYRSYEHDELNGGQKQHDGKKDEEEQED